MTSSDNGIADGNELTWIAGSIVLSDNPPQQLKFWRKKFGIKQADLAKKMTITPSVLSDYEKGRRPSPGANFIKRYLQALYELAQSGTKPSSSSTSPLQPSDGQGGLEESSGSNNSANIMPPPMTADAVTINQP